MWGHVILHATTLIRLCPSSVDIASLQELLSGRVLNVSYLFGRPVWVPIPEPQLYTIDAHYQKGIYVGFDSPSIICYINSSIGRLLRAYFANYWFEEDIFSSLKGGASILETSTDITFQAPQTFTSNPDPRTPLAETEVSKILHL